MADPVWPVTLPQNPFGRDGAAYEPPDNHFRTNTEIGPPKSRRKFTARYDHFRFVLELTKAEVEILDAFYQVTLQEVRRFQWVDFRKVTGATCKYRFSKAPSYVSLVADLLWEVTIDLERLPG